MGIAYINADELGTKPIHYYNPNINQYRTVDQSTSARVTSMTAGGGADGSANNDRI